MVPGTHSFPGMLCLLQRSIPEFTQVHNFIRWSLAGTLLSWLTACNTVGPTSANKITYTNPPSVGSFIRAQRELVACETIAAARYMADFGFFHPQCVQLTMIGPGEVKVTGRERIELREGPMWLVQVEREGVGYFMPVPWHDWL